MNPIMRAAVLLATLALSACASTPPNVEFHRTANDVKSIAILTPAILEKPSVVALSGVTPLALLGPLGAIADSQIQASRADDYHAMLIGHRYSPEAVLTQDISAALRAEGYTVVMQDVARPAAQLLTAYPAASQTSADAYLDVALVNYGYLAGVITAPYHPLVELQFKLVRARDGTVLMQGTFGYSIAGHDVEPDPAYDFSSFKDIMADPDRSIAGLNAGFALGAKEIAKGLQ